MAVVVVSARLKRRRPHAGEATERQEKTMDTTQGFCCASVHVNASHIYGMDMLAIFPCQYVYSWILAS